MDFNAFVYAFALFGMVDLLLEAGRPSRPALLGGTNNISMVFAHGESVQRNTRRFAELSVNTSFERKW